MTANTGRILVGFSDETYLIKFVGDVRVTLCASIDSYIENIFSEGMSCSSVVVDLTDTIGLDSTTLGLLAKLSLYVQKEKSYKPLIISTNPSISRLLDSMGFEQIFDIDHSCINSEKTKDKAVEELPVKPVTEKEAQDKVLEAHRVLMALNEDNRRQFRDLVSHLERLK